MRRREHTSAVVCDWRQSSDVWSQQKLLARTTIWLMAKLRQAQFRVYEQ